MDQKDLGVARYDAGERYLQSLKALELCPDALYWAFDATADRFVLVLVTSLVDFAGPLAISELLFKAYDATATPEDIDPFIVRLHSPKQAIFEQSKLGLTSRVDLPDLKGPALDRATIAGEAQPAGVMSFTVGDLQSFGAWVYPVGIAGRRLDAPQRWRRFERAVQKRAA